MYIDLPIRPTVLFSVSSSDFKAVISQVQLRLWSQNDYRPHYSYLGGQKIRCTGCSANIKPLYPARNTVLIYSGIYTSKFRISVVERGKRLFLVRENIGFISLHEILLNTQEHELFCDVTGKYCSQYQVDCLRDQKIF